MSNFLFSYGTLIPEHAPNEISGATATFFPYATGWVHGVLYDLGDYPGAVLDPSTSHKVFGTVFRLPENSKVLDQLDQYEGFDAGNPAASLFIRKEHPVTLPDGDTVDCWIYEYNGEVTNSHVLAGGRYHVQKSGPRREPLQHDH